MRLLVAEDEQRLAGALKVILERNHYSVDTVYNGDDAVDYALSGVYDCILLDVMMPGKDGFSVVRKIRTEGLTVPVLFLTAKGELEERVEGLDAGGDDYLTKPFESEELLARIRALLRRSGFYQPERLTVGNLNLDCTSCELFTGSRCIRLNRKEFQLMECFMRSPGRIYSSEQLMERVWGWESGTELHVVWTNISGLRRKISELGAQVCIQSVRGIGYCLEAAVSACP